MTARWPAQRVGYLWDLLRELVVRELKLRYKGSALGVAWSLLLPLSQLLVFSVLFRSVLRLDVPHYPLFVFIGILGWNWFQTSLVMATSAITDNRGLIRRPGFPAAILPAVTVATNLLHYLLALPVLLAVLLLSGVQLTWAAAAFPLIVALQFLLTLSLAYVLASVQVTFRDVQHLLGIVLMLLFYLTPVFYAVSNVPAQYRELYQLNPVARLLEAGRDVLLEGHLPSLRPLLLLAALTLGLLYLSYSLFARSSARFAEEL